MIVHLSYARSGSQETSTWRWIKNTEQSEFSKRVPTWATVAIRLKLKHVPAEKRSGYWYVRRTGTRSAVVRRVIRKEKKVDGTH